MLSPVASERIMWITLCAPRRSRPGWIITPCKEQPWRLVDWVLYHNAPAHWPNIPRAVCSSSIRAEVNVSFPNYSPPSAIEFLRDPAYGWSRSKNIQAQGPACHGCLLHCLASPHFLLVETRSLVLASAELADHLDH